jgi:hypothetical protein
MRKPNIFDVYLSDVENYLLDIQANVKAKPSIERAGSERNSSKQYNLV